MTGSTFNSLVGDLDYPMFIVTACADGERSGCLIGFATQISIKPPRFLTGLSHKNHTYRVLRDAEHVTAYVRARATLELDASNSVHTEPLRDRGVLV